MEELITMKIEKTWVASSKAEKAGKEEFVNIAGQWNVGVEVSFTKSLFISPRTGRKSNST